MKSDISSIYGLEWQENWRVENGQDSFVVPYATIRPSNIVFHGEQHFDYGHYGIHLGQGDRLTFLGSSTHTITGHFIDCRRNSPTLHQRVTSQFHPDSGRALYIPPGVAHAFDSLENVFTINDYRLFLPDPVSWLSGSTEWNVENDVINLLMDIQDEKLPTLQANGHEASDVFYQLIVSRQQEMIPQLTHEYPFTEDVTVEGQPVRILLQKRLQEIPKVPEWTPIEGIDGAGWAGNPVVWSGENSGFVPLWDAVPFYVVDHGENGYSHDAFGIHLGQEDRLIFLGPNSKKVRLTLVDCRSGSDTLHNKVIIEFSPNPLKRLVIPNGVAHRFEGLEKVFTVNRPKIYVDDVEQYEPGNDVIDWPADRAYYPELIAYKEPAPQEFYARQARAQRELMAGPPMHATPMVLMVKDEDNKPVRVVLRKQAEGNAEQ